jgi:hypothetical protein
MATVPGWDYFGTHDWPGHKPAVNSLYAVSMNRYAKLPHWEDEFIWSQWERKGTPEPVMRAATGRNLWRQIAWGKRGISLFNYESEWLHDSPNNWNNSMLNIEADLMVPRYCTGVIPVVERKANLLKRALIDTELVHSGVAILIPMHSVYGAAPDGFVKREGTALAEMLLGLQYMPFMVPEECIGNGTEDLSQYSAIVAPWAINVSGEAQDRLMSWVRDGGTLLCSGPFGLFDEWGKPTGGLMAAAFGPIDFAHDSDSGRWATRDGDGPGGLGVISASLGRGKVICSLRPIGQERRYSYLGETLADVLPGSPPVTHDVRHGDGGGVELLLRRAVDGTSYLFCINLSVRDPAEGHLHIKGEWSEIRDISVEGGPMVPMVPGQREIPVLLQPGECICLELAS